jgi:ABC-type multidrug transport system fused ATPase/permease subunit
MNGKGSHSTASESISLSISDNTKSATTNKQNKDDSSAKKKRSPAVSMIRLFRFATPKERYLIALAAFFSIASGALQPVSILIYGQFINNLTSSLSDTSNLLNATLPVIHIMAYMGTASLIAAYISSLLWIMMGESQTRRIRGLYLHSVLNQDMSWFDSAKDGSLNTRLASDTQIIQDGISEKFGLFVTLVAQFIGGFIVAFVKGRLKKI